MNTIVYTLAFTTEGSLNTREIHCFMKSLLLLAVLTVRNYAVQLLIVVWTGPAAELVHFVLDAQ